MNEYTIWEGEGRQACMPNGKGPSPEITGEGPFSSKKPTCVYIEVVEACLMF